MPSKSLNPRITKAKDEKEKRLVKITEKFARNKSEPKIGKRKHKKNFTSYSTFIYKVLKQVHAEAAISTKAMDVMNCFVQDIMERLASEASRMCKMSKKSTLGSREIHSACRLVLPGEIAKHAVSEGTRACEKYLASVGNLQEKNENTAKLRI